MIAFWWIVLDLPEISKSSNKIWNRESLSVKKLFPFEHHFMDVVLMCTIFVSNLMISSALPGQYLSFCRNEFIVLMEYATSESSHSGNQSWLQTWGRGLWKLVQNRFKAEEVLRSFGDSRLWTSKKSWSEISWRLYKPLPARFLCGLIVNPRICSDLILLPL